MTSGSYIFLMSSVPKMNLIKKRGEIMQEQILTSRLTQYERETHFYIDG